MWFPNWTRRRPRRKADCHRIRPHLESLEERALPSAVTTVYTESNNPAAGANAVLAFRQNADGTLTEIGSFNTGGTGDEARDGLKEIASFIARHLKR